MATNPNSLPGPPSQSALHAEVAGRFARSRADKRSCLLVGIQRGSEMMLNPVGDEASPLQAGDQLILLSRVFPNPSQALPMAKPANATIPPNE